MLTGQQQQPTMQTDVLFLIIYYEPAYLDII